MVYRNDTPFLLDFCACLYYNLLVSSQNPDQSHPVASKNKTYTKVLKGAKYSTFFVF